MVNRDRAWSLWLLPTRPLSRQETEGLKVLPILCGQRLSFQGFSAMAGFGLFISSTQERSEQHKHPTDGRTETNLQQESLGSERWGLGKRVPPWPSSAELRGAGPLGQPSSVVYLLYAILRCHEPNAPTLQEGTVDQRLIQMSTRFNRSVDE